MYEKRAPAFTDNPLLAFNAPFFVTAEILKVLGWKKEEFVDIDNDIENRIAKHKGIIGE